MNNQNPNQQQPGQQQHSHPLNPNPPTGMLPPQAFSGGNNVWGQEVRNPDMKSPTPGWPPNYSQDPRLQPTIHSQVPVHHPYPPAYMAGGNPVPSNMPTNPHVPGQVPAHAERITEGQSHFRPGQPPHQGISDNFHHLHTDRKNETAKAYEPYLQSAYFAGAAQQHREAVQAGPSTSAQRAEARAIEKDAVRAAKSKAKEYKETKKDAAASGAAEVVARRG